MDDFSSIPSARSDRPEPVIMSRADKLFIRFNGNDPIALATRGTREDLATIRNQGIWKLVSFSLDAGLISVGAASVGDGTLTPTAIGIGLFASTCLLTVDRTLANRFVYQKGKRELKRAGVSRLGFGGDDVAYGVMLGTRLVIGISKAILLGTVAAQFVFAGEIQTYQRKAVAPLNVAITAAVERELAVTDRTLAAQARQDTDLERAANRKTETVIRLDLANTRQAGSRTASAEKRQLTKEQLAAYEARGTLAHQNANRSGETYQNFLRDRSRLKRERIESDPAYVPPPRGLLENTTALLATTRGNIFARGAMMLFDGLLVAIEFWSVVILFGARPTIFSVNSARDYFVTRSQIARNMVALINDEPASPPLVPDPTTEAFEAPDPLGSPSSPATAPKRRGVGRPRGSKNRPKHRTEADNHD